MTCSPPPIRNGAAATNFHGKNAMKDEFEIKQVQTSDGKKAVELVENSGFSLTPIPPKIDLRDAHAIRSAYSGHRDR